MTPETLEDGVQLQGSQEQPEAQPEAPVEELPPAPEILAWVGEKPVIGISVAEPDNRVEIR